MYRKALESKNLDLVSKTDINSIRYPTDPEELREYLKERIRERSLKDVGPYGGDIGLYEKAKKSGNLDLINTYKK